MRWLRIAILVIGAVRGAGATDLLQQGAPAVFELASGESRLFQISAADGEYISVTAKGEQATLTCTLRFAGNAVAAATSFGGTGGPATLSTVADRAGAFEFEIRRGGKEAERRSVTAVLVVRREASPRDRIEAQAYRALADAKTADALDAARRLAIDAGNIELAAQIAGGQARALFNAGKYQAGIDLAEAQLPSAKRLSDTRLAAQLLYMAGLCEILLERNREAVPRLSEALSEQRAVNQPYEVSATLQNLSAAHMVLGDCRESLQEAEEALAIRHTLGDEAREAFSMTGAAKAHLCLGEGQEALDGYLAVIPLWRKLKDARNEAASLNDMGVLYSSLGAMDRAMTAYQSALRLRDAAHDAAGQGETLVNIGQVHLLSHEYAAALPVYGRALELAREGPDQRLLGYALEGRAEALFHTARKSAALDGLHGSVDALQKVGDRSGEAYAWRMLGEVEASSADYQRAIALAREVGDRPSEAIYLNELARLERGRGQLAEARANLEQALPIIESTRVDLSNPNLRMSYLSASRDAYELYVDVLAQASTGGDSELAAFQASERAHARTLLDQAGAIERQAPKLASLEEIRIEALDGGTVLLEYLLGERCSWLWFVSRDSFERFQLPGRVALERSSRQLYTAFTSRNIRNPNESPEQRAERWKHADTEAATAAARLRNTLLGPVWNRLGNRRVLLVNDGLLHLVPFAALGIRGEVVLTPSASVLVQSRRSPPEPASNRSLLIIADPVFSASDPRVGGAPRSQSAPATEGVHLVRLPLSRSEADGIASLLPRGQVEERLGFDASPAALRGPAAARFATIHIAAHTIVDSRSPELSGIALSMVNREGKPENGFLRLRDIYNLRLTTGLVTLSACETALGKDMRGEGMIGLSHAFLYAGARRVVASLWKVEDSATEYFMKAFYRGMYRERLSPAAALHAAQAEMRHDARWTAPYYWAPFTIEGDWK